MAPRLLLSGHLLQVGGLSLPVHFVLHVRVLYLPALFAGPTVVARRTQLIRVFHLFYRCESREIVLLYAQQSRLSDLRLMDLQIDQILLCKLLLSIISQIGVLSLIQRNIDHRQIEVLTVLRQLPPLRLRHLLLIRIVNLLPQIVVYPKSFIAY